MKKLIMFSLMVIGMISLTSAVSTSPPITQKVELLKQLPIVAPSVLSVNPICITPTVFDLNSICIMVSPLACFDADLFIVITKAVTAIPDRIIPTQLTRPIYFGMGSDNFRYSKSDHIRNLKHLGKVCCTNSRC